MSTFNCQQNLGLENRPQQQKEQQQQSRQREHQVQQKRQIVNKINR